SRYFTYIVFSIALITAIYWYINDINRMWPAITAIFIIACPCALLLSNSFTNGNILRILVRNHFYLRNATTIEDIANANHIVFDKTGTLTSNNEHDIKYIGKPLSKEQEKQVAALASCSNHPLSKALANQLGNNGKITVQDFNEITGAGIEGFVSNLFFKIGSSEFVTGQKNKEDTTSVYVKIEDEVMGCFNFSNHYRDFIPGLIKELKKHFRLSLISGDNAAEKDNLKKMIGEKTTLLFYQKPEDKLQYIQQLQMQGEKVMMIGDGLNDAGALKQSNIGIAVAEQTNNFTPASDAIIKADKLSQLNRFIELCRANKNIVMASFILSIVYNIIGLFFAVQGNLSPLIAAILMPSSSLSIVLITFGSSNLLAKWMKL
ncbi:MAG: HAD-IC family P-type ATPase, partial [Chitinophagaceae bacterium]